MISFFYYKKFIIFALTKIKSIESINIIMIKEDVLKQCTVDGLIVKLPTIQLDRKLYQEVAKSLELIGGNWNRKSQGFIFKSDPKDLLEQVSTGEKRNLKKEFQFFETPGDLADELVELADIKESDCILEPSAGQGAIIEAILRKLPTANIFAIELMNENSLILNDKGFNHQIGDFLKMPNQPVYDKIIANPPFNLGRDILHVKKMYECLKSKGRIVTIMSKHWKLSGNKKETQFREWLNEVGADIIDVDAGAFKKSGTNIPTCIIVVDKK